MLQLKNINKRFTVGGLTQVALDNVSFNLRENEFVAILGPSGSGKTTLLNIIGGLDRYDSGDMIINGISTKKYSGRDWDSYRNHTIGFVFQSYNLIPHQSILANVELALTISGISRKERRERAKAALEKVGLAKQLHKKPNQMSGGQMQRVAIARALINNPDILLADEPTGALDSETSIQVMELLKEVAKDRLVVMVTHNPELAEQYATRTVKLKDGKIISDSNPYEPEISDEKPIHKNMGKASMSVLTAASLSFNNLRTKKARTILTSFAGSIGIIGIALILSLSNGVSNYIDKIQKDTMTSYPIKISAETIDLSSVISGSNGGSGFKKTDHDLDAVYSDPKALKIASSFTTSIAKNNLTEFKKYLDNKESKINKYIGENGIVYSYPVKFSVYTYDPEGTFINTDGTSITGGYSSASVFSSFMPAASSNPYFKEFLCNKNDSLVSDAEKANYELLSGNWPASFDEVVLIVDQNKEISSTNLYALGILPISEYKTVMQKILNEEEINIEAVAIPYDEIIAKDYRLIPQCDMYKDNGDGTFSVIEGYETENLFESALKLKISGIVKATDDSSVSTAIIGYTRALGDYIIEKTNSSKIITAQKENPDTNILTGLSFSPADDESKVNDFKKFIASLTISEKAKFGREMMSTSGQASAAASMSEQQLAGIVDGFVATATDATLIQLYDKYVSNGSFEENMTAFGYIDKNAPSSIGIYADSFDDKNSISDCIAEYNASASEENRIVYTDYVGLLISSVTTIIDVIAYVLIAFVAVSLIVSSIMIGIITYISVLERTKEIGILRALGASKHNISQVFNAETFIIGLVSGLMGIGITLLLLIPGNALIHFLAGVNDVNAVLPLGGAIALVILSVILTLIGGIIPSKKAANKDPVTALRTE